MNKVSAYQDAQLKYTFDIVKLNETRRPLKLRVATRAKPPMGSRFVGCTARMSEDLDICETDEMCIVGDSFVIQQPEEDTPAASLRTNVWTSGV